MSQGSSHGALVSCSSPRDAEQPRLSEPLSHTQPRLTDWPKGKLLEEAKRPRGRTPADRAVDKRQGFAWPASGVVAKLCGQAQRGRRIGSLTGRDQDFDVPTTNRLLTRMTATPATLLSPALGSCDVPMIVFPVRGVGYSEHCLFFLTKLIDVSVARTGHNTRGTFEREAIQEAAIEIVMGQQTRDRESTKAAQLSCHTSRPSISSGGIDKK